MDFQQLMKQASANQSYTLKKHEQKKKQQEEKNKKEEEKRKEAVRKASALLHDMKKTSEKREREYRGIVNSRAADYEKAVSRLTPATSGDHSKGNKITPSNGRPHPPATTTTSSKQTTSGGSLGKKSVEFSQAGKGKTKSSTSISSTKSSAVTSSSKTPKPQPSSKPSASSASSGAATSSKSTTSSSSASRGSCGVKPPVNFQELMRLAEQKKKGPDLGLGRRGDVVAAGPAKTDTGRSSDKGRPQEKTSGGRSRSGSPLGKLLLEKSSCRGRTKNGHGGGTGGGEGGGGGGEGGGGGGGGGGSQTSSRLAQETAVSDRSVVGSNLRELAQSRVVGRGGARGGVRGGVRGGKVVGSGRGGESSQRMPESALIMRERFRKELEASANRGKTVDDAKTTTKPSAKSNSFYASSHAELSKEGRPNFAKARMRPSGPYQSSWVSEMNEYVEQLREGGGEGYSEEEEEEDGLGDFVVDDEEGGDVSSAIREIFGYDRRRYRDEDEDDRMMESSFAQQQYEEMRSSRIGRQEDAEDMRRENERLARKRRKRGGMETSLSRGPKQTKLSFR